MTQGELSSRTKETAFERKMAKINNKQQTRTIQRLPSELDEDSNQANESLKQPSVHKNRFESNQIKFTNS